MTDVQNGLHESRVSFAQLICLSVHFLDMPWAGRLSQHLDDRVSSWWVGLTLRDLRRLLMVLVVAMKLCRLVSRVILWGCPALPRTVLAMQ